MKGKTKPTGNFLISSDPGKLTGVCIIDISEKSNYKVVDSKELDRTGYYDYMDEALERYKKQGANVILLGESFVIDEETIKLTRQNWSSELLGVLDYWAYKHGFPKFEQLRTKKAFGNNERLKLAGFWHKGGEGHANDAFRHAMAWLADRDYNWSKSLKTGILVDEMTKDGE